MEGRQQSIGTYEETDYTHLYIDMRRESIRHVIRHLIRHLYIHGRRERLTPGRTESPWTKSSGRSTMCFSYAITQVTITQVIPNLQVHTHTHSVFLCYPYT